jgi:hypothetical protein
MKVQVEFEISEQLCKDLLTTCVEGGSHYWLACLWFERDAEKNVVRIVGPCDTESHEKFPITEVTLDTMAVGLQRILSGEVKVSHTTKGNLLPSLLDPDECLWDADDADCVLQAGLLNDIVYG